MFSTRFLVSIKVNKLCSDEELDTPNTHEESRKMLKCYLMVIGEREREGVINTKRILLIILYGIHNAQKNFPLRIS